MDLIPDEFGGNQYLVNGSIQKLAEAGADYKTEEVSINE